MESRQGRGDASSLASNRGQGVPTLALRDGTSRRGVIERAQHYRDLRPGKRHLRALRATSCECGSDCQGILEPQDQTAVRGFAQLFAFVDSLPEAARFSVKIPAAPGRKERTAELALRFSPVTLCRPHPSPAPDLPDTIRLTMVDVREF